MSRLFQALTVAVEALGATLAAQSPTPGRVSVLPPGNPQLLMQQVSAALGVDCAYCHGARGRGPGVVSTPPPVPGQPRPTPLNAAGKSRMDVARDMFQMVAAINKDVQAASGKAAADATRVQCATCHRGVPIPKQLAEILTDTAMRQGADAVALQFNELRSQFYGRQAYDFSEGAMADLVERLARVRPTAAVALMEANIAYYPTSSISYLVLGIARSQAADYQGAIDSLKKALELDPNNNLARGRLAQLQR